MISNRPQFLIHGNGHNSSVCPNGIECVDMPGHNKANWDRESYSFSQLAAFYKEIVPENALVWGHSLGGHISLNLALLRPDITVIASGMALLNSPVDLGVVMTPFPEFGPYQKVDRSDEEIMAFHELSALGDKDILAKLMAMTKQQDPYFNEVLMSMGLSSYDWNEVEKAKSLGNRFHIIVNKNEGLYDYDKMMALPVNIIKDDALGHTPWLLEKGWFDRIAQELALRLESSVKENNKGFTEARG